MRSATGKTTVLAMAILGLAFIGSASAAGQDQKQGRYDGRRVDEILKQLNLTPQQETRIRQLQNASRQAFKDLRRDAKEKRKELSRALDEPNVDRAKIDALVADLKGIEGRLLDQRIDSILKMKAILTPGQYRTFNNGLKKIRREEAGQGHFQENPKD